MAQKIRVLYLCTGNSCRSQMAEGYARLLGGQHIEARSAGIEAQGKNPRAVSVMAEDGIDISSQESTRLTPELLRWADSVITLCDHADRQCDSMPPDVGRMHWPLADPAEAEGTDDEIMARFREIRDEVRHRVGGHLDALVRQDRRRRRQPG